MQRRRTCSLLTLSKERERGRSYCFMGLQALVRLLQRVSQAEKDRDQSGLGGNLTEICTNDASQNPWPSGPADRYSVSLQLIWDMTPRSLSEDCWDSSEMPTNGMRLFS
jgi:hypothetical protein